MTDVAKELPPKALALSHVIGLSILIYKHTIYTIWIWRIKPGLALGTMKLALNFIDRWYHNDYFRYLGDEYIRNNFVPMA